MKVTAKNREVGGTKSPGFFHPFMVVCGVEVGI